jgi:DNA-binding response OmpR family regulator
MSAIANNPASQLLPTLAQSVYRALQHDPSTSIRTMDLNEMRQLSSVTKFLVLVTAPDSENRIALSQLAESDSFPGSSDSFSILELFKRAATQTSDNHSDSDVMIGDVKVNFATMEAHRRGEPLFMTALEFKILKYLIANTRRVISRDELLNEVWGYQNYPSTRTVDNQVAKLRKKLEPDPSRPVHLRTVHGAGYKFLP